MGPNRKFDGVAYVQTEKGRPGKIVGEGEWRVTDTQGGWQEKGQKVEIAALRADYHTEAAEAAVDEHRK